MIAVWLFALGLLTVPVLPHLIPFSLLAAIVLGLAVAALYGKQALARSLSRYACYYVLGLLVNTLQLHAITQSQLSPSFDNTWQSVTFKIVSIPQQSETTVTFLAKVQSVHCEQAICPDIVGKRIRLSWYSADQTLSAGQIWSAKAKLKRPRGFVNPGGFDYHALLLSQGVVATGYVHSEAQLQGLSRFSWSRVRQTLAERVNTAAEDGRYQRFWPALLVADRSGISAADWQTLQATGTIHLMAISGLHIGLVSLWAFWLGQLAARACSVFGSRSAATMMHWLPSLFSCAMALIYAALAGFSIPTVRALVACLVINACWLFGLRIAPLTLLGAGVAVVALGEPLAGQNNGFWLSFTAVFLLVHSLSGRLVKYRPIVTIVWLQVILSLGLSIPLLWLGQGVSWVSPFANVIAVPVVSFLVVPGLFLATVISRFSLTLAHALFGALDFIFHGLWQYLLWLQTAPSALLWYPKALTGSGLAIAFVGVLLLLTPAGLRLRGLGALSLALAALIQPPPPPSLRFTVMDVGQGLATLVQTPGHTWVYDTGPWFSASFDAGSRIVAPYLRAQGVRDISVMVSHSDNDHSGGTQGLLSSFNVKSLVVGERLSFANDPDNPYEQQLCKRGQQWQLDSVSLRVLWPPQEAVYERNNASCVVLVQMPVGQRESPLAGARMFNVLLTGDIDWRTEAALLSSSLLPSHVDVLIAPHHGSKSSSGADFVRALNPRVVVFSAGYKNRYNHPHPEVVARYHGQDAQIYTTATSGAMVFEWRDGALSIVETRESEAKLWF